VKIRMSVYIAECQKKESDCLMKLKQKDGRVAWLIQLCFPEHKGRRPVQLHVRKKYRVSDYWDGGSRDYCCFVDLSSRRLLSDEEAGVEQQEINNPFNLPIGNLVLRSGVCVVENRIFCGKDMGIHIYIHANDEERFV